MTDRHADDRSATASDDVLVQAIAAVRERMHALALASQPRETLDAALEDLRTTLEELTAADAELRQRSETPAANQGARFEEHQRHMQVFDQLPDAHLVTDRSHHIANANLAATALLGSPRTVLIGKPLAQFVPLEERQAFNDRLSTLDAGHAIRDWTVRLGPTGGGSRPVTATVDPAFDGRGQRTGSFWMLLDVRQRERARQALRESEARYRSIVDMAREGIVTIDAAGIIQTANPSIERMFGYRVEEVQGRNVNVLMPAPWREAHDGYIERYLRTGEARIIGSGRVVAGQRKDGSRFPLAVDVGEFRDERGPMFVGLLRDRSIRKAREDTLRRFEQMISATGDLMAFVDRNYVYEAVNEAFASAFGVSREELVGRPVVELLGDDYFETSVRPWLDRCLDGAAQSTEQWHELPAVGRRCFEVHFAPYRDEGGVVTGAVIDARDRTEFKRLEDEAEQHRTELAHAARLSALGEFATGIAHELNQPLSAIASYCDAARRLVERDARDPADLIEMLRAAGGQARRAGTIIRRLRSLARREPGTPEALDLSAVTAGVLTLLGPEAGRLRVQIDTTLADDLPSVHADEVQLQQVVLNLVRNAMEAVDQAGSEQRTVFARTLAGTADSVELWVEDTGPGLTKEAARSLFTPFFTTKEQGMGVGLAICRNIVEMHGGHITAESRAEGGARVRVSLPVLRESGQ